MLLGICGDKFSGKSTVSDMLESEYGFTCRPFADPIKYMANEMYDFSKDQLWGDKKDEVDPRYGFTPRFVLQFLGTEVGRGIHEMTWIWVWERNFLGYTLSDENIVVDDMRFPNEAEAIRKLGGKILRVHKWGAPANLDSHSSENPDLIVPDYEIGAHVGDTDSLLGAAREIIERERTRTATAN